MGEALVAGSPVAGKYGQAVGRESACEQLEAGKPAESGGIVDTLGSIFGNRPATRAPRGRARPGKTLTDQVVGSVTRNIAVTIGREIGRQIIRASA